GCVPIGSVIKKRRNVSVLLQTPKPFDIKPTAISVPEHAVTRREDSTDAVQQLQLVLRERSVVFEGILKAEPGQAQRSRFPISTDDICIGVRVGSDEVESREWKEVP